MPRAPSAVFMCALATATACHRTQPSSGTRPAEDGATTGASASLLGGERGLDHVGIAVQDLEASTHTYHDLLGFNRPMPGKLPNGIQNVNYYFADSTYLETMIAWDRVKADWLGAFTDHHTGAFFAVLSAFSPESTRAFLSARGITVSAPYSGTIQTSAEDASPGEKWQTFFLPPGLLPGESGALYFISYAREARVDFLRKLQDPKVQKRFFHKNTALGLRAVWFAVPDLALATRAYESLGLPRQRAFKDVELGADGQVMGAGVGEIWLFAPTSADGAVARFLQERGEPGILGVTLLAGRVETAAEVISAGTGVAMPLRVGLLGKSIRVPPGLAQGVWLEFAQQ